MMALCGGRYAFVLCMIVSVALRSPDVPGTALPALCNGGKRPVVLCALALSTHDSKLTS
jgi:hypothetical protein